MARKAEAVQFQYSARHEEMMRNSHAVNSNDCANAHKIEELSLLTGISFYFSFSALVLLNWLLLNVTRIQNLHCQSRDANMHHVLEDYFETVKWWIMDSRSYFGHYFFFFLRKKEEKKFTESMRPASFKDAQVVLDTHTQQVELQGLGGDCERCSSGRRRRP